MCVRVSATYMCECASSVHSSVCQERTSEQKEKRDRQREIMLTQSIGGQEKKTHVSISFPHLLLAYIYFYI